MKNKISFLDEYRYSLFKINPLQCCGTCRWRVGKRTCILNEWTIKRRNKCIFWEKKRERKK